jgi:hypothetical protein
MRFQKDAEVEDIAVGKHKRAYVMMAIPTLGMVPIEFMFAAMRMQMPMNGQVFQHVIKGMEVGAARNKAVQDLMTIKEGERPQYLFFFGDDMIPEWDGFVKLYEAMEEEQWDMLTGLYFLKGEPPTPLLWRNDHVGRMQAGRDFTVGDRVRVDLTGLDFTLIRTSLLEKMKDPWFKTGPSLKSEMYNMLMSPNESQGIISHTEDAWFIQKASQFGAKIGVHTGVRVSHLDVKSGNVY